MTTAGTSRSALRLFAAVGGTVGSLLLAGRALPGPPATTDLAELSDWVTGHGPVTTTMAAARLVALVLAAWVAASGALALCGELLARPRLVRGAVRASPPGARRLLASVVGVSAHLALLGGAWLEPAAAAGTGVHASQQASVDETGPVLRLAEARAPDEPDKPDGPDEAAPAWVVAPGDHLWSIAERLVADALGEPPSDAAVAAHMERLVAANQHRLPEPHNPDLIHPGTVLELPDITEA